MIDLLVIANGRFQRGLAASRWDRAIARLREIFGNRIEIQFTSRRGEGTLLARRALKDGVGWLAAAGGDGTIHEVVNGYFDHAGNLHPKSPLSFLPCGRGNDWLRTLGASTNLFEMIEDLVRARVYHVDVGYARFMNLEGEMAEEMFINIAEAGMGANALARLERGAILKRLPIPYLASAVIAALNYSPRRLQMILDGRTAISTEPLLSLIAANGCYFGAGMHCAPMARPDDGLLEVISIGDFGKTEIILSLPRFISGTYLGKRRIKHLSVKTIELSCAEKMLLELDGEPVGTLPATLGILPRALQLRY